MSPNNALLLSHSSITIVDAFTVSKLNVLMSVSVQMGSCARMHIHTG